MGKPNQIDHVVIDKRRHSSLSDLRSFTEGESDTDPYLVVIKFRERLSVNK